MLKIIAIILVMVYVVMPLLRFLLKGFVITQAHKMMSEQEIRAKQNAARARKEGSIDVDFVPPSASKTKTKPADDGDYVPYEEIK
ncbi:DUF4834 family protein [Aquirufa sp. KTFRIE-69F]|jgi:hypothetical protein|uniref:DUF4834 family protein n=1 Tax=Aquirufa originis TaxID=3096514 RepID=A0ABW6D9V4_9BACT